MAWTVTIHQNGGMEGKPYSDYQVTTRFSNRFASDKAYLDTDRYLVVLDGYLFNAGDLRQACRAETTAEAVVAAYERNGPDWLTELRGSYNGLLYDKHANLWTIFVNQFGDRPLFYYQGTDALVVSTDFNEVVAYLKENGKAYQANEKAAYSILTYGYMIDASTHIAEIARLLPGKCLDIRDGRVAIRSYFRFENTRTLKISFDEAIEQVDALFRKAVAISFNKDLDNGYRTHLADMSGGLDSRMVSWVARDLGFGDITNICYAQSQSQEWKAAFQVANALHNDFIYMPLDTCNFVYDVDEIVQQNYGLAVYIGITGGKRLLSYLNADVFGLEMTGMLGDVVIGAFIKKAGQNTAPTFNENRYSNLLSYDFDAAILREYENSEMFKLYTRGFLGAMSTYMIRNRYSDVASPFLDVEFFLFCLSLPLEYRIDHRLYRAWILRKYPEAARLYCVNYAGALTGNVAWKNTMRKIRKGTEIYSNRLLEKIGVNVKGSPASMNPMDYWYRSDAHVRKFIHDYYAENIFRVSATTQLARDMGYLFQKGSAVDKLLVLTVLAAYKFYDLHWA